MADYRYDPRLQALALAVVEGAKRPEIRQLGRPRPRRHDVHAIGTEVRTVPAARARVDTRGGATRRLVAASGEDDRVPARRVQEEGPAAWPPPDHG